MKKVYYYATYNTDREVNVASIIKAKSIAQIKRASMHLFEHYKKCETYDEAFHFIVSNIFDDQIKDFDVTNF